MSTLVACGGDGDGADPVDARRVDAPAIDAPDIDAPDIDAPDIDAPDIDAPVDAPIDAPIDAPPMVTLTIIRSGDGTGTVTSPSGIACGTMCTLAVPVGTDVTLTAAAAAGATFVGWTGGGCTGTGPCTVDVIADLQVEASFAMDRSLVVTRTGTGAGTVTSSPAGINCGADCDQAFGHGTVVTLTATPSTGSLFTGWSGDCTGTGPCTVTLDAPRMVTATFTLRQYQLVTPRNGNGDGVTTSSPAGISCLPVCDALFDHGTMVTLTATPAAGSLFTGWSGGGCTGTGPCTVTMTALTVVTPTFTLMQHTLMVAKAGNGAGTVTSTPAGIDCGGDCDQLYNHGTVVTLTASPGANSIFTGWSGGGCSGTGTCDITVTAADTVTATFSLVQYTLTVAKAGTGAGTVTSSPAGIDCGGDCDEPYDHGTVVTLTATPDAGSTFDGWSGGGCSGTGTCDVTMTAADTVTATFTRLPLWDGTWTGSTSQSGRPITLTVLDNRITRIQVGWQISACGTSGTTTTNFAGIVINPTTGAFTGSAPGVPLSYTISGTFALDESGASGTINFTFSQPFPPFCNGSASATWSATRT